MFFANSHKMHFVCGITYKTLATYLFTRNVKKSDETHLNILISASVSSASKKIIIHSPLHNHKFSNYVGQ